MSDSQIRGILFDLGNVLIGVNSARFAEKMKSVTGLEMGQVRSSFAGGTLVMDYECGRLGDDEFLARLCARLGVTITRDDFTDVWSCMFSEKPLMPDALLGDLARNHYLWAISNTNGLHFEYIRRHYTFLNHFRGWSLSYEVGAAKPDPGIFEHALEKCGLAASEALLIDDQLVNVESARNLGIDAVQFLNPTQTIEELRKRKLFANDEIPNS